MARLVHRTAAARVRVQVLNVATQTIKLSMASKRLPRTLSRPLGVRVVLALVEPVCVWLKCDNLSSRECGYVRESRYALCVKLGGAPDLWAGTSLAGVLGGLRFYSSPERSAALSRAFRSLDD